MRKLALAVFGLLLGGGLLPATSAALAPAKARPVEAISTLRVDGELVIDTQGRVEQIKFDTPLDEAFDAPLKRAVGLWQFKPVQVDGMVRRVSTPVRITLGAVAKDKGFEIRVDNVVFPDRALDNAQITNWKHEDSSATITVKSLKPPQFPMELMRADVSGRVLLGLRIDANGTVAEVSAIQSMLVGVRGNDHVLAAVIKQFEKTAMVSAKRWTFNVVARSGSPPARDMTLVVPVEFVMQGVKLDVPGKWQAVVRLPRHDLPWLPPQTDGMQKIGVSDVGGSETMSVSTSLQLTGNVIGTSLR